MRKSVIKTTTEDDLPALQRVLDGTGLFPSELLPEMLAPTLKGETAAFWLTCHVDGSAVGFCYTRPEELADGTWNMLALAVHPDLQGAGFGTALMRAAEEYLRDQGQRILLVDTSSSDEFALTRRFYLRNGYEEEACIRDFWSAGDHKVIFRKAL